MINYCVKYDELNVELLLIESPQSSLYVYLQFLLGYRDVVLFDEIGEQDRSSESLFVIHRWEPLSCHLIDGLVAPVLLFLVYESIFEETQAFVDEKSDKILYVFDR